jgi:hypothetical protein
MKKIIAILSAMIVAVSFASIVSGGEESNISISMDPDASASIFLNETSMSTTGLNSTTSQAFNLDNDGNVTVDVVVNGTDATSTNGGTWTLEDGNVHDAGSLDEWNCTYQKDGDASETAILKTDGTFATDLSYDASIDFTLYVRSPRYSTYSDVHDATVTFTATAN